MGKKDWICINKKYRIRNSNFGPESIVICIQLWERPDEVVQILKKIRINNFFDMKNTDLINKNSMKYAKVFLYVVLGVSMLINIRFIIIAQKILIKTKVTDEKPFQRFSDF